MLQRFTVLAELQERMIIILIVLKKLKKGPQKIRQGNGFIPLQKESPGSVFWHEKGWSLFQRLVEYMRMKQRLAGYKEINTPELLDKTLWRSQVTGKNLVNTCLLQKLPMKTLL